VALPPRTKARLNVLVAGSNAISRNATTGRPLISTGPRRMELPYAVQADPAGASGRMRQ
jgi:hypothetical protein